MAQVCRRQAASCRATSTPLQHITQGSGYLEAAVLRSVTGSVRQTPKLWCCAVLKTHPSSFSTLFCLPSIVKAPPGKKILCSNQKWELHNWNLFQSSATSSLKKKKKIRFLNSCLVPFSECPPHKIIWCHTRGMCWEFVSCLSSGQNKSLVKVWICLGGGMYSSGLFSVQRFFVYGGRNFLKILLFSCSNLFEI